MASSAARVWCLAAALAFASAAMGQPPTSTRDRESSIRAEEIKQRAVQNQETLRRLENQMEWDRREQKQRDKLAELEKMASASERNSGWDEINRQQRERAESKLVWGGVAIGLGLLIGFVRLLWALARPRPRVRRSTEGDYPTWITDAQKDDRR